MIGLRGRGIGRPGPKALSIVVVMSPVCSEAVDLLKMTKIKSIMGPLLTGQVWFLTRRGGVGHKGFPLGVTNYDAVVSNPAVCVFLLFTAFVWGR